MYTSSFVTSIQLLLKTTFLLHKARVCPTAFWATFAPVFVLINWFIEFPSSAVANRFELRCQGPILKLVTLRENRIFANNRFPVSCKVI